MNLFPIIQPELYTVDEKDSLNNVNIDVLWNDKGPLIENGNPKIVDGVKAAAGWARRAILTARNAFEIFSANYGCDIENIIGKGYQLSTVNAEIRSMVEEALLYNKFITSVSDIKSEFKGSTLKISCKIRVDDVEVRIAT